MTHAFDFTMEGRRCPVPFHLMTRYCVSEWYASVKVYQKSLHVFADFNMRFRFRFIGEYVLIVQIDK